MNLTKKNGCYAKELFENLDEIKDLYDDNQISVSNMRATVLKIIEPAWINRVAKKRFISYLEDCYSKRQIYNLCWNTIQKAMKYTA